MGRAGTTANTLYFVYLPPNVVSTRQDGKQSSLEYCGYHHAVGNVFYAVIPYATCNGCVFPGNFLDTLTEVTSHELAEAITDPALNAWWDSNTQDEIGDICNRQTMRLGGFMIQTEWSNSQQACVIAPRGGWNLGGLVQDPSRDRLRPHDPEHHRVLTHTREHRSLRHRLRQRDVEHVLDRRGGLESRRLVQDPSRDRLRPHDPEDHRVFTHPKQYRPVRHRLRQRGVEHVLDRRGGWNPGGWFQIHPETVFDHKTQQIAAFSRSPEQSSTCSSSASTTRCGARSGPQRGAGTPAAGSRSIPKPFDHHDPANRRGSRAPRTTSTCSSSASTTRCGARSGPAGGWNPGGWFKIHPEIVFDHTTQQITAFSRTPNNIDLFVIGFDNAVWSTFWTAAGGWSPGGWFKIHPETVFDHTTQKITAFSRTPNNIDLFVVGFDNAVWSTFWTGS